MKVNVTRTTSRICFIDISDFDIQIKTDCHHSCVFFFFFFEWTFAHEALFKASCLTLFIVCAVMWRIHFNYWKWSWIYRYINLSCLGWWQRLDFSFKLFLNITSVFLWLLPWRTGHWIWLVFSYFPVHVGLCSLWTKMFFMLVLTLLDFNGQECFFYFFANELFYTVQWGELNLFF